MDILFKYIVELEGKLISKGVILCFFFYLSFVEISLKECYHCFLISLSCVLSPKYVFYNQAMEFEEAFMDCRLSIYNPGGHLLQNYLINTNSFSFETKIDVIA